MNALRICRLLAVPVVLVLAGCSTGHPCFSEHVMYADRSTACQYGRTYQCDNGDWIAARKSCSAPAPEVASSIPAGTCIFGGVSYASGAASCNAGVQYRCDNGSWRSLDRTCPVADAPLSVVPASGASCSYQATAVPSSSAICQSGTTYLCNNGQWVNLGTVCESPVVVVPSVP